MASNERIRKYLDAGSVLGQVSRGRAEEIVRELVNAGDIQRGQAQEWVDSLVERSRKSSEQILDLVRHEVAAQLSKIDGKSLESLANQVADVLKKSAEAGRRTTRDVTNQAGKQAAKVTKQASQQASKVTKRRPRSPRGRPAGPPRPHRACASRPARRHQGPLRRAERDADAGRQARGLAAGKAQPARPSRTRAQKKAAS